MPTRLGLIVVNYGSHLLLETHLVRTVADIRVSSRESDAIVVVVDNFTSQRERDVVAEIGRRHAIEVVAIDGNLGFGGGVNRGVARALSLGATEVLLLNPDAVIGAASVDLLVDHVRANPRHIAAPLIRRPDGAIWSALMDLYLRTGQLRGSRFRPETMDPRDVLEWVSGACMTLTSEFWEELGGFDEDYFMYWEDVDLCRRVSDLGGRSVALLAASAVHDEGGTQARTGRKSSLFYYFNMRNRLQFACRHLPPASHAAWKHESWLIARRMLRSEGWQSLLRPRDALLPILRGEREGRKALRAAVKTRSEF